MAPAPQRVAGRHGAALMPRTVLLLMTLLPAAAWSATGESPPPAKSWTFTMRFENDLFTHTDRFYTNGIKLSWVSPELDWFRELPLFRDNPRLDRWGDFVARRLPFADDARRQRNFALSVGQMMYTPADTGRTDLIEDDRPYAGWLYGSAAFHSKSQQRLDTFEIQAGLTGPWSLAEETQDLIHQLRGFDRARGWDHQIDTELGFALVYEMKYRIVPRLDLGSRWGADAILHAGGAAGTVFTQATAGAELRLGWNLPEDFGTSLIRPAGETNAPAALRDPRYLRETPAPGIHLFASATGRWVLHDIFLDGNTFSDSHNVDKEELVGDFAFGVCLLWGRFKLSYAQVLRTDEFEAQPDQQQFGSISLSFTY
jgi:hypothetical protein